MRKSLSAHEFLFISKKNERPGSGILSIRERKVLILTRGFIAVISYIGFELSKIAVGTIDNSIIFSADALMYAFIAMIFLKERYSILEWLGIVLAVTGISIIGFFDIFATSPLLGIFGGTLGIISSTFMAIILILTSIIVQHDYPIRVAFYQCLCGLIVSIIITCFFLPSISVNDEAIFSIRFLTNSIRQGMFYALALICFFRAFYYVNTIIVAISSYSLDLFTILFETIFYKVSFSYKNSISSAIISLGIGILIYAEHKKSQKEVEKS